MTKNMLNRWAKLTHQYFVKDSFFAGCLHGHKQWWRNKIFKVAQRKNKLVQNRYTEKLDERIMKALEGLHSFK